MGEHLLGELLRAAVGHVAAQPVCVEACLVHSDETDGGEVVIKRSEIVLGVGVEPLVEQTGDNGTLCLERARGNVHEVVKTRVEIVLVACEICYSRHIDGDNADRTGRFAASEEAAGFLSQLTQIEAETAAHAADVARLHVAVDVVGEIRCAVLRGHLEEQAVILGLGPVEITCDGIGGNGVLEASAVGVAVDHYLNERLVYHVHLGLAVLILERHLLAADDSGHN